MKEISVFSGMLDSEPDKMVSWWERPFEACARFRPLTRMAIRLGILLLLTGGTFIPVHLCLGTNLDRLRGGSDLTNYYAFVVSLGVDHDVVLDNQYSTAQLRASPNKFNEYVPATGHRGFAFAIGFPLLEMPFFYVGAGLSALAGKPIDGLNNLFSGAYYFGLIFYGYLGLMVCYDLIRRFFNRAPALLAVVAGTLTSNLLYYFFNALSHVPSFLAVSTFLLLFVVLRPRRKAWHWLVLGLAAGSLFLVRWQDILFGVVLFVDFLDVELRYLLRKPSLALLGRMLFGVFLLLATVACLVLPQLYVWKVIYGSWLTMPQGEGYLSWDFHLLEILVSTNHGWISWNPVVALGLIGLIAVIRRKGRIVAFFLLAVVIEVLLCANISDWFSGYAFGMRRLVSALPVIFLGLAGLFDATSHRRGCQGLLAIGFAFLLWFNAAFMVQLKFRAIPIYERLTFYQYLTAKVFLSDEIRSARWIEQARMLAAQGKIRQAYDMARIAVDTSPHHARAYRLCAALAQRLDQPARAEKYLREAERIESRKLF